MVSFDHSLLDMSPTRHQHPVPDRKLEAVPILLAGRTRCALEVLFGPGLPSEGRYSMAFRSSFELTFGFTPIIHQDLPLLKHSDSNFALGVLHRTKETIAVFKHTVREPEKR